MRSHVVIALVYLGVALLFFFQANGQHDDYKRGAGHAVAFMFAAYGSVSVVDAVKARNKNKKEVK